MKTNHSSTVEAVQINAKLVASAGTIAIGYLAGSFSSIADSAKNEAEANPEGIIAKGLNRTIREHWASARDTGYNHTQSAKDVFSFDEEHIKPKEEPEEVK